MTEAQYQEHVDDNSGFCTHCDKVTTQEVEPDAEEYECPDCGNEAVMGMETALLLENIEIADEDDDLDDEEFVPY